MVGKLDKGKVCEPEEEIMEGFISKTRKELTGVVAYMGITR